MIGGSRPSQRRIPVETRRLTKVLKKSDVDAFSLPQDGTLVGIPLKKKT